MRRHETGFTLIELLVVVTIIVVLLALLVPAMDRAIEQTQRAVCATNQRQIVQSAIGYGLQNRKALFMCRGREVGLAFDPKGNKAGVATDSDATVDWPAAMASAGLASEKGPVPPSPYSTAGEPPGYVNNMPGPVWNCPGRAGWESYWYYNPLFLSNGPDPRQMVVSYMYYGGINRWRSFYKSQPDIRNPPAPRSLRDAGDRALVSDVTAKVADVWGGPPSFAFQTGGTPAHRDDDVRPAGHNQAYLDGSAEWVPADRLLMIHSWAYNTTELYFFWQRDLGPLSYNPNDSNDPFRMSAH